MVKDYMKYINRNTMSIYNNSNKKRNRFYKE